MSFILMTFSSSTTFLCYITSITKNPRNPSQPPHQTLQTACHILKVKFLTEICSDTPKQLLLTHRENQFLPLKSYSGCIAGCPSSAGVEMSYSVQACVGWKEWERTPVHRGSFPENTAPSTGVRIPAATLRNPNP